MVLSRTLLIAALTSLCLTACEDDQAFVESRLDTFQAGDAASACGDARPADGDSCSVPEGAYCPTRIECPCSGARTVACQCVAGSWSCPTSCGEVLPCAEEDIVEDTAVEDTAEDTTAQDAVEDTAPSDTSADTAQDTTADDTTPADDTTADTAQDTTAEDTAPADTAEDTAPTDPTACDQLDPVAAACFSNGDCGGGERCEDTSNDTATFACCQTGAAGSGAAGDACTLRGDCASGVCLNGLCTETCADNTTCPGTMTTCATLEGSSDTWCQP